MHFHALVDRLWRALSGGSIVNQTCGVYKPHLELRRLRKVYLVSVVFRSC
jgi:hypothetical protein